MMHLIEQDQNDLASPFQLPYTKQHTMENNVLKPEERIEYDSSQHSTYHQQQHLPQESGPF
jgi:hypothetical protein